MTDMLFRRLHRQAQTFAARMSLDAALTVAARGTGVRPEELGRSLQHNRHAVQHKRGRAHIAAAVQCDAFYLAHTHYGQPLQALGAQIGVTKQAVCKLVAKATARRDEDPGYDRRLDELELQLMETV